MVYLLLLETESDSYDVGEAGPSLSVCVLYTLSLPRLTKAFISAILWWKAFFSLFIDRSCTSLERLEIFVYSIIYASFGTNGVYASIVLAASLLASIILNTFPFYLYDFIPF